MTSSEPQSTIISFRTSKFDISKETPNPVNPIPGEGVLTWLGQELARNNWQATEPDYEDWGWYIDVTGHGSSYLVGASGEPETGSPSVEWMLQIRKTRTLKEKLLRRNQMTSDDPLVALIDQIIRAEREITQIEVSREA